MGERRSEPIRSTIFQVARAAREQGRDIAFAWAASFVVEGMLAAFGLGRTLEWIDSSAVPPRGVDEVDNLWRDARTARRAYRVSPFRGTCLRLALVQFWLGRRRGAPVDFVIGVRADGAFGAHAWVERGELKSDETRDGDFAVILRSSSGTSRQRPDGGDGSTKPSDRT